MSTQAATNQQDLKTKFLAAELSVNENKVQAPESVRMKLYGLAKQIKEGDCRMPKPPDTNQILKAKWESWTACAGTPVEKAIQEYISIVEKLEPGSRAPLEKAASRKSMMVAPQEQGVRKQGTLYKQRDVMKGWRPRHFVLENNLLSYYLEPDDPSPRATLDLTGCSVSTMKSVTVDGIEYFPFAITHAKTSKSYYLSCDSKLETDIWVAKLLEAANVVAPSTPLKDGEGEASSRASLPASVVSGSVKLMQNVEHANETRSYIPEELVTKVEQKSQYFLDMLAPDAPGWEPLFEKNGLVAKKKPSGNLICVKGELQVAFNLLDVWALITDGSRQCELDPQRNLHERIKDYSNHTFVDYIRFKGVWPTSPRDFVSLSHWRMLTDGSVIIFACAEKYDDLRPPFNECVRGEITVGGYWLQPNPQGTKVSYLIHSDLKGSLGSTVVNFVSTSQPAILSTMRRILTNDQKKGKNNRPLGQATTYADLVSTISGNAHYAEDQTPSSSGKATGGGGAGGAGAAAAAGGAASANLPLPRRAGLLKQYAAKSQKINVVSLFILFMPVLLYYVVDSRFRSAGFLAGLLIAVSYLIRQHLGTATAKTASSFNQKFPHGKMIYRFPVELGRLALFLEQKIQEKELDITFQHMVIKAAAMTIQENPTINGHLIMNEFYTSKTPRVDVSISIDVNEKQTVIYKIEDADIKPVEYIADEIMQKSHQLRSSAAPGAAQEMLDATGAAQTPLVKRLNDILPAFLFNNLMRTMHRFSVRYGLSIPSFGIKRFPLGVCTIVTSPSVDGETDMDFAYIPDQYETSAPITVSMGGIRILPSVDSERKVSGTPVLNFAVTMNTAAISMNEGRTFCSRLQQFLNDPSLLEKVHTRVVFEREESIKRKQFFGSNEK